MQRVFWLEQLRVAIFILDFMRVGVLWYLEIYGSK